VQAARNAAGAFDLVAPGQDQLSLMALLADGSASGFAAHLLDESTTPGGAGLVPPGLVLDSQGRLDILTASSPGWSETTHDWFDGSWHTEDTGLILTEAVLDASGAMHAVSCVPSTATDVIYATNKTGSWLHQTLRSNVWQATCKISVTPAGEPRIAFVYNPTPGPDTTVAGWLTPGASSWTEEEIPLGSDGAVRIIVLAAFAPASAQATLLYVQEHGVHVRAIDRGSSGWGAPQEVGTWQNANLPGASSMAAISPDGTRIAIGWNGVTYPNSGGPSGVAVRSGGTWTVTPVFDTAWNVALGFTPAGKLWFLDGIGNLSAQPVDYLLYEER
jgi:hypothetical protein